MLRLRRGTVVEAGPLVGPEQRVDVEVDGTVRPAVADVTLVGECAVGDDVVVNVAALDLGLGSGGFDIVHCNLTRGLGADGPPDAHVMKLNYTPLQHAVVPVEGPLLDVPVSKPVAVAALHGQLAPLAFAVHAAAPWTRLGLVQTAGGALPGGHSRIVTALRDRGLLCDVVTAAPAYGGEREAITTIGAMHHGLAVAGWDAAVCSPGPGIIGSASALGHGGMAALDSAHAALALGCPVVLCARMSSGDPRPRHAGLSHHTRTVARLLLGAVTIALPDGRFADAPELTGHRLVQIETDTDAYLASGLPATTMGRTLAEDELFFASALASGAALAAALAP